MELKFTVEGGNFSQAGYASSEVKKLLKKLALPSNIIRNIVISLYEAEVNVVAHAWEGEIRVEILGEKIVSTVSDKGPGIPDIDRAMEVGYSTASEKVRQMGFGAGMGLPNIKKNCDNLNIESTVGVGTTLTIINFIK